MVARRLALLAAVLASSVGSWTVPTAAAAPARTAASSPANSTSTAPAGTITADVRQLTQTQVVDTTSGAGYTPLVPARLLDTRESGAPIQQGGSIDLVVTGVGGVPTTNVDAVVLNVTGTDSTADSFITIWPTGGPRPLASNLNLPSAQTVPNLVVAKVGVDGKVSIYNNTGATHIVVDVQGWFASGSGFTALVPSRLLDTRDSGAPLGEGASIDLKVTGVGGVPVTGASAVVLNVTVTEPSRASFLTVWPAGDPRPLASNVNMAAGQTVPNLVVARIGADGKVSIYNNTGSTHVVVDIAGWFTPDSGYTSLVPVRLLDTRANGGDPLGAGAPLDLEVTGVGGVPVGASAVVLNVTATDPSDSSFLTVWPAGEQRPFTSNLNMVAHQTVPNSVIAKVGVNGKISIYNNAGTTHVVVDVEGWFAQNTGAVDTGRDVGWRFVPNQVLVAPGTKRLVQLVQTGLDGVATGSELPEGITFSMSGTDGVVTARTVGGGFVELDAGTTIQSVVVGAHIPDVPLAPTVAVTVASLKPGVVEIDDAAVAFPPPGIPLDGDLDKILGPGVDASGVGPFTWAQIQARLNLPDSDFGGLTGDPLGGLSAQYPVVLHGDAPPVGTLIVGNGASSITGRVVASPTFPSLTIDGYSLVTVELVGLQEIYQEIHYSLTYQDLVDIGAAPAVVDTNPPMPAPTAAARAADPATGSGPPRPTHSPGDDPPADSDHVAGPGDVVQQGSTDTNDRCTVTRGAGLFEFSPVFTADTVPTLNVALDINAGEVDALRLEVGAALNFGFSPKVKVQPTASLQFECPFGRVSGLRVTAPGPLAAFMSLFVNGDQKSRLAATLAGGPKLEAGMECSLTISMVAGFSYERSSGTTDISKGDAKAGCKPVWDPSANVGDGTVGVQLDVTFGLPLVATAGVQLGGVVAESISRLLSWFNKGFERLGAVDAATAEITPQLHITVENDVNAIAFRGAKSGFTAESVGKVYLNVKPLSWILKRFGAKDGAFTLTLYQQTFPITSAYAALNSTRIESTIDGEDVAQSPAIYVQADDQLDIVSTLAPASKGVGFITFPITTAKLYEVQSGGVVEASDIFPVEVVASKGVEAAYGKTSIEVRTKITKAMCDQLRDEPKEFVLVGDAPFNLFVEVSAPAYGGRFEIQCVDGKIAFDPLTIDALDPNVPTTVHVISSGAKDDEAKITGRPDWLGIDPGIIPLTGNPAKDAKSDTEVELTVLDQSSHCVASRTAKLTVTTKKRGKSELTITEANPCYVRWALPQVTAPSGVGAVDVTADLLTKGRDDDFTNVEVDPDAADWLSVSPSGQLALPDTHDAQTTTTYTFTVQRRDRKCVTQLPRSATIHIHTATRGDTDLKIIDPKVEAYEDCGARFTPSRVADTGVSQLTVRDDQLADDTATWSMDDIGSLPDWLSVTPQSGNVSSASPASVHFVVLPTPYDHCVGRPQVSWALSATVVVQSDNDHGPKTLPARVSVTRPAIAPDNCPRANGAAVGDPHMTSMDGISFEGQILGEYIYARSPAGAANPYQIVVRTQPTSGAVTVQAPTSVTALAITQSDHKVETYRAANGGHDVLIDGVLTTVVDGVPLVVSDTMSVTRTGIEIRFDMPGITVSLSNTGIYNLRIAASIGTPMEGLLGSPDGNAANDFVSPANVSYTVSQITTNQVPQFYDYVTSWRITDIAQSPFTRHYAQFGAANPGFSQQILDDFGPGVDAALGGQSRICSGALTTQQRYGLALELSIGSSVAQLGGYICSYSVAGTVTADGGLPSSGLRITVDGIGLRPCVTTSGLDGRYVCTMAVDLAEVNAVAGTGDVLPMTVSVSGTWPGVTAPAATGSTVFTTKAPLASGPTSNTVDLSIDPNSVPRLDVSGTVMGDGVPIAGPRFFSVAAFDAVGAMVQSTSENADVDVDSGRFSFSRLLPPTAVRAVVTTTLSSPENETYTIEATSLVGGRNAVTLNVASSPVHLHVTGTLIDENGASLSNVPLIVMFRSSTGVVLSSQGRDVTADPTTHRYDADFIGHSGATSADLTATVGAVNETFTASVSGLVDGTNPAQTFDVSTAPVRLALTGHVVDQDRHGLPATFRMDAFFFDSAGNLVTEIRNAQSVTPDDAASGHYATNFTGHRAAVRVLLRAYVGAVGEYVEQNITGLHHGANSATFEIQYGNPVVTISGKLTGPGNTKVSDQVPIRVIGTDAGDAEIYNHVQFPTLDPDGAYHVTVTMSTLVTKVSAIAQIGVSQSDWFHLDPVVVHAGANTIPFDVDYRPATVTITGTILKSVGPPAVPIAPTYLPIPLGIGAYWPDDGGELGQFFYTQPNVVTLDSNGGYSFDVTLPLKTTSVEARLFITGRQDTVTMVAGFTPGTHRTITLNAVHNPPTITVHGVARIDGQLELHPSSIDVTVKSYAGATLNTQFTRTVSPNATTGVYSSVLLLPNGTTRADVTVHPRNGSNTYPSAVENIVPGDQRDVTIDFDDGTTRIALSGNLMVFGVPTTRATLYATTTGGPNPQNSMTIGSVVVDQTTGHYATTFTVPNGTTHVSVSATLSTNSWSDIVLSHDVVPAIVGVGTTTDTWSADATLLRVTGTLTDGGQRVTGLPGDDPDNGDDATLVFGIDVSGPTSNYSTNESALYEGDNTFEFGVVVPSDSASVNLTVLGVVPSTDPDPALAVALTGHGSIIDQTWNVDVSHSAAVTNYVAAGVISNNPLDPADQRFRVDVIGVSYTDDSTPYVEVFHDSQTYPTLPGGGYGVGWALPANVNLVRSTVTVLDTNGDPLPGGAGWSVVTHISPADAGSTVQGTLNIDLGQTTYGYAGNVNLDGCSGPLLFRREFWVFNSPTGPTGPYVPASGPTAADWPGGTLVLNDEVLPDGNAPYHHSVRVNIPSDTTFVGTVYFDHNSQGTGINTTAFVSPANIDVTADETAVC